MMYYYFNEYGDCFCETYFDDEFEAENYANFINAEYFCSENDV